MKKQRKRYTPEEKVAILRRQLLEKEPISKLCDELRLRPTVFYRWQKEFFENGAAAFEPKRPTNHSAEQERIVCLEKKNPDQGAEGRAYSSVQRMAGAQSGRTPLKMERPAVEEGHGLRAVTGPAAALAHRCFLPQYRRGRVIHEARVEDMPLKMLAAIVSFVLLTLNDGAHAQQSERSVDTSPAWNDNSLITVQKKGGNPTRSGDVKIEFYGHDAFKVTSPAGLTVLTDPWRNDSTGLYPKWFLSEFPAIRVDIVLSTHAHFDHDAVERPKGLMVLERLVGQFKLGDIEITGLADKHKCEPTPADKPDTAFADLHVETCPPNNVIAFDNAIELIQTGGIADRHLGRQSCDA
jgi:transposase-like protein